ncbi:MAG: T9SS type A sorting domain-containing protein [Bacteroidota bacterium]
MRKLFLFQILLLFTHFAIAQSNCSDCEIDLPELPADTIFLSDLPDGALGSFYEADISFRLPVTTTPVTELDTTLLPNLPINEITILGITGLPEGLSFATSQDTFAVDEGITDGCIRFCGTPASRGNFRVQVNIVSRLFVITRESSVFLDLYIGPATSSTEGFNLENNIGCGATRVSFRNNNPSLGEDGFQYFWNFGNGKTSTEENPAPQDYVGIGEFIVEYEAIVDTAQSRLQGVTILEGDCNDIIGRPDYYISVLDPEGTEIYLAQHLENPVLPATFNLDIPLQEDGTYTLRVNDEDGGLEGSDDNCADIPFTFEDSLVVLDGVRATLEIFNPIDTITASDTVFIFPFPAAPSVSASGETTLCEGELTTLKTNPYDINLQWSRDGQAITGANDITLEVTQSGQYTVSYTSPQGGCTVVAMPVSVVVNELPVIPVFENVDNLLRLVDETVLTDDLTLEWYLEGELLADETDPTLCAGTSGNYVLLLRDNTTGCENTFEMAVEVDTDIINCNISNTTTLVLQHFRLYPNPVADILSLELETAFNAALEVRLIDALGRTHWLQQLLSGQHQFDLSTLPSGWYLLQLTDGESVQTHKILKQ